MIFIVSGRGRRHHEELHETELIDRGIKNIKKLAVVFSGKDVYIKESEKKEC